jgi:dinuclear metal center YbgI/SA1388 family protein
MQIGEIIKTIEDFAPLALQESWDNAGLTVGDRDNNVESVVLCLDVTTEVLDEAISKGAGLVISHHPVIFRGLMKLTGSDATERIILKAIQNNIALYAAHTNIDRIWGGVNSRMAGKLGLKKQEILIPEGGILRKLIVFVPEEHASKVREAIFSSGAGHIGEYDQCSFNISGEGSFRGSDATYPFAGKPGVLHFEKEIRIETIYPAFLENRIIKSMIESHPYEEVAYDIYSLGNKWERAGIGMVGEMESPLGSKEFLEMLRSVFKSVVIRHTRPPDKKIARVAVCGGSGSSLIHAAMKSKADVYVSGDFKYHDFFEAGPGFMIADIGHFESEQFTMEIFNDLLTKKFPNFAVHFSEVNTNPIHYFK